MNNVIYCIHYDLVIGVRQTSFPQKKQNYCLQIVGKSLLMFLAVKAIFVFVFTSPFILPIFLLRNKCFAGDDGINVATTEQKH